MSSQSLRLTFASTLILAMLGALLWLAASAMTGRPLDLWEACVVSAAVLGVVELWRLRRLRRQRRQLESLRDSALW